MKQYLVAEDYQSSAMPWRTIIPPGNEKTVVKVGLNGNVVRYEIEDSQLKRVDQSGYDSATNFSAQFFPGRTKRELLTIKNNDSEFVGEIYNTKTEKKTTISFDGAGFDCKSVAFSSWRRVQSDCLLGYTKNKRLRITERDFGEETPSSQGANFQLKTGVFRENEMVRKKLVRLWQNGDVIFPVSLQFVHDFYQHTEEGHEFGVGRVAGSKREQIFWRTDGGEFHRRTFLTAFHRYPRLGPKVGNLYYFSRDPLSGYIQLFRLQLDKLPTYE